MRGRRELEQAQEHEIAPPNHAVGSNTNSLGLRSRAQLRGRSLNTPAALYWSSTTDLRNQAGNKWAVDFQAGGGYADGSTISIAMAIKQPSCTQNALKRRFTAITEPELK